jgi:hypothetical protein
MPFDTTPSVTSDARHARRGPGRGRLVLIGAVLGLALALLAAGCGSPPAGGSTTPLMAWTFDEDLEGWETGTTDDGWGTAEWRSWCGSDRDRGCVILDGTGGPGHANAWIQRTLALPSEATTLRAVTTAHNRDGADSDYRVRLIDASDVEHILIDWSTSSGSEDAYDWFAIEASIAAFAGTTVTLSFEGADNGPGSHEQRYYDDISIF